MANNCDMQECQQQVGAIVEETIAITQRSTTDCVRYKTVKAPDALECVLLKQGRELNVL